jgi:hypothetical protein
MADSKAPTHTAFALQRLGKRHGEWLEIGRARLDSSGVIHLFLNRTPIGGFNGYAYLAPNGAQPPSPEPEPQRPRVSDDSPEDSDEEI